MSHPADGIQALLAHLGRDYLDHFLSGTQESFIFSPKAGEAPIFEEFRLLGYIRAARPRDWELTQLGRRVVLRPLVPPKPNAEELQALELVSTYQLEKHPSSDYREWIDGILLRKRLTCADVRKKQQIIDALYPWYLDKVTNPPGHYKMTYWGWLESSHSSNVLALLNGLMGFFRSRYEQESFGPFTLDELRDRGVLQRDTHPYVLQEMISGLRWGAGNPSEGWTLPMADLEELISYESVQDYLEDRRISRALSEIWVDIANATSMDLWSRNIDAADLEYLYLLRKSLSIADEEPASLSRDLRTPDAVWRVVLEIVAQFRHLVEDRNLWREFWNAPTSRGDTPRHRPESSAQVLFYAVAHSYCRANNLDLTPEAETGRGPVDFKLSSGYSNRILVEVKLSTNKDLVHGYEVQLELYKRAERPAHALYLIVNIGEPVKIAAKLGKIAELKTNAEGRGERASEFMVVDATPKTSASKADGA